MSLYTNFPSHHNYQQSHHTALYTVLRKQQYGRKSTKAQRSPPKKKILLTKLKQNMLEKRLAKPTRFVTFALYMASALPLSKHYNVTPFQQCSTLTLNWS
jgi:hypothetical protein